MVILNQVLVPTPDMSTRIPYSRVVHIKPDGYGGRTVFLSPLIADRKDRQSSDRMPEPHRECDVDGALASGAVRTTQWFPPTAQLIEEEIPDHSKKIRDAAWERIGPLVETPEAMARLFSEERFAAIRERATQCKARIEQLYRDLRRYFRQGMNKNALLPDFCWAEKGALQAGGARRGPKGVRAVTVTPDLRDRIEDVIIDKVKLGSTFTELFDAVQRRVTWSVEIDANGRQVWVPPPEDQLLSPMQVRHAYNRLNGRNALSRVVIGARKFRNDHQQSLGNTHTDLYGPGARYEIDATGSQVEVVRESDGSPAGTALVYLVVDTWSNAVVGYYLGLMSAKADSAKLALHQAFSDKVTHCREYGIEIEQSDWPMAGRPACTITDHGSDFGSKKFGEAAEGAHFDAAQARVETPRHRADGERTNGTLKTQWARRMPGWAKKLSDGRRKARHDACLTVYELHRLLIEWILWFNKYHPLTYSAVPAAARAAGTFTSRNELWAWGLRNCVGYLAETSRDQLATEMLPKVEAEFTKQGLKVGKRFYSAPELTDLDVFSSATLRKQAAPLVKQDPSMPNLVYLYLESENRYLKCRLIDPEQQFLRYSLDDAEYEFAQHQAQIRSRDADRQAARIQMTLRREAAVTQAREQMKEARIEALAANGNRKVKVPKGESRKAEAAATQLAMEEIARGVVPAPTGRAARPARNRPAGDPLDRILGKAMEENLDRMVGRLKEIGDDQPE
jgi:transposase InsO family protein